MKTEDIRCALDPAEALRRMAAKGIDLSALRRTETETWAGKWTMDLGQGTTFFLIKGRPDSWAAIIKRGIVPAGSGGFYSTPEQALVEALKEAGRIFGEL